MPVKKQRVDAAGVPLVIRDARKSAPRQLRRIEEVVQIESSMGQANVRLGDVDLIARADRAGELRQPEEHDRVEIGLTAGALTGLAVADWILSGKLPAGLAACDPARFQKSG